MLSVEAENALMSIAALAKTLGKRPSELMDMSLRDVYFDMLVMGEYMKRVEREARRK